MPLALHHVHPWNPTPEEGIHLQNQLKQEILFQPLPEKIARVGGLDVGYRDGHSRAAAVVFDFATMKLLEQSVVEGEISYPYIPGLFSFREAPALLAAIEPLKIMPDVWLCDGQGIAHPRRFGLACHLGVLLDLPTVGCAKSVLTGKFEEPLPERGNVAPLIDNEEVIGMAVRTRANVAPVFVSVGHRADLKSAVKLVLACGRGLRLPEPIRLADWLTTQAVSP
ncbi:MAG TPA: deoxyribonuclease V [Anaerolineales bacterium]|nr:deoxyribonuclease V [Anaerolineales bacterium]